MASTAPSANQFLGWNGSQWAPSQPPFSNLSGSATPAQLPAATATSQGAIQLSGDLGGTVSAPSVGRIQGVPVAARAPAATQVLTYNGAAWTPATPAAGAGIVRSRESGYSGKASATVPTP